MLSEKKNLIGKQGVQASKDVQPAGASRKLQFETRLKYETYRYFNIF